MSDAQTHFTMYRVALLMATVITLGGARVYERCELARDLLHLGIDKEHVATWVCIAFHESRFDTAARNPHSGDHGLLQISELYWCGPGKACGVPCSAFRDEDISDDVQCALRIHEEHNRLQGDGFLAWVVYPHHCKHNAKKYLIDCEASTKSSTKFDDRARSLKSLVRNTTTPQLATRIDIDKLDPPYLAIKQLFRGNYVNEFERNYYNNKKPLNWVNFKIDNIDELKLPDFSRNRNIVTTTPATTTIDPELIGIKPPSPRKIESNQFRRRMMNLEKIPTKTIGKTDYVPLKPIVESFSTFTKEGFLDLSHNPFIKLKTIPKVSTEIPYIEDKELTGYSTNYKNSFTATPKPETTRSTSDKRVSVIQQNINLYPTTPNSVTSRRGKARYVPELSDFGFIKTTIRPSRTRIRTNESVVYINQKNNESSNKIKTAEVATGSVTSDKSNQSSTEVYTTPLTKRFDTQYETTVSEATSKATTRSYSRFTINRITSSEITTFRPTSTQPTTRGTTTVAPVTQKVMTTPQYIPMIPQRSTEVPTVPSTQSIFDLYLNPTKATIRPFKFVSFENSPFRLRIFSGGTTTPPPSFVFGKRHR